MIEACVGSILKAGVMRRGAWAPDKSGDTWYLKATWVLERLARLTVYSPAFCGAGVMKAGFGATFSRLAKFSRRIVSVPKAVEKSAGLYARATSPMRAVLESWPFSKRALTVSTIEVFRPVSCRSGCLCPWLPVLVNERPERMDWLSPVWSVPSCAAREVGRNGEVGSADDGKGENVEAAT